MSDRIIADVGELRKEAPILDFTSRMLLVHNLVWMHQVIVASENLMEVARDKSKSPILRQYLTSHLVEETDHALWLAEDLKHFEIDVSRLPLYRSAVEFVGSQYYFIHHVSPSALLGYMAVLEGFPFPLNALKSLEELHGKDGLRCLRYHAEHDLEHRKELFKVIDQLDDPVIYQNAIRTQLLLNEAFRAYSEQP